MLEALLETRYPQLSFLLNTHRLSKESAKTTYAGTIEASHVFARLVKEQNPSLILLIGMDSHLYFLSIEKWLETHPQSDLLVFEEDLNKVAYFLKDPSAHNILKHPQVHLRYVLEGADLIQALQEAVKDYPTENVLVEIAESYKEKYDLEELSLMVFRKATIASSLFNEDTYYHLLFRNLFANFLRLPSCFYADTLRDQFKNIPAVICGAGPSLAMHIPLLKKMENKAMIVAGGSTLAALSSQGVFPHIGLALDPNPEEYDRLKANHHFEVPLLFGNRVVPSIFRTCNGYAGYMRTFSGGFVEQALEENLELTHEPLLKGVSQEGLSVTVMCFAAAVHFGCNPIFLSGIDLAYVDGKRYSEGVVNDPSVIVEELKRDSRVAERLVCKKNRQGEDVYTTVKWVMEAATIEEFAKKNPSVRVWDCVEKGLGFHGLEKITLAEALEVHLQKEYDIRGYLHQILQNAPHFVSKKEKIEDFVKELKESFRISRDLVKQMLQLLGKILEEKAFSKPPEEHPLITLYNLDIQEQKAFEYFLEPIQNLSFWNKESRFSDSYQKKEKKYEEETRLLQKKWGHFERLIEHYFKMF